MKCQVFSLYLTFVLRMAAGQDAVIKAAERFVPGLRWQAKSIVIADFTCGGHKQTAVLGTNKREVVVAVFLNGTNRRPVIIRDEARDPATVELAAEGLDYEPDYPLPGFQSSKTCSGLNLSDGHIDSRHLYWNHGSRRFDSWSL